MAMDEHGSMPGLGDPMLKCSVREDFADAALPLATHISGRDGTAPGIGLMSLVGVELLPVVCHESSMVVPLSLSFAVVNGVNIVGIISVNAGVGNSGGCCC